MTRSRKVVAYITRDRHLLVFRHRDFPEAGLQVPAGTIREGESPLAGVQREVLEETGLTNCAVVAFLGVSYQDMQPYRDEVQERHVFHLVALGKVPKEWTHLEEHDGLSAPTAFNLFWMRLDGPALDLIAGQGALLNQLNSCEGLRPFEHEPVQGGDP